MRRAVRWVIYALDLIDDKLIGSKRNRFFRPTKP